MHRVLHPTVLTADVSEARSPEGSGLERNNSKENGIFKYEENIDIADKQKWMSIINRFITRSNKVSSSVYIKDWTAN